MPVIAAVNKVDRLADKRAPAAVLRCWKRRIAFAAIVPVSAEKGTQLDLLTAEIARHLPSGEPLFAPDELTDRDERFLAAEFVREKIFRLLGEELPYATTVAIDSFEDEGALRRIHATIYVDKASHRAIVIGARAERR